MKMKLVQRCAWVIAASLSIGVAHNRVGIVRASETERIPKTARNVAENSCGEWIRRAKANPTFYGVMGDNVEASRLTIQHGYPYNVRTGMIQPDGSLNETLEILWSRYGHDALEYSVVVFSITGGIYVVVTHVLDGQIMIPATISGARDLGYDEDQWKGRAAVPAPVGVSRIKARIVEEHPR